MSTGLSAHPVLPDYALQGLTDGTRRALVAVLHALFDDGPDFRIAALPFGYGRIPQVRKIGNAHLAREESADRQVSKLVKKLYPGMIFFGGPLGPRNPVENLFLLVSGSIRELLVKFSSIRDPAR